MKPEFEVIIPVVNPGLADVLIRNMEENTLLHKRVIIIDNTPARYMPYSDKFMIEFYNSFTGTVNESFNLGISQPSIMELVLPTQEIFVESIELGFVTRYWYERQKAPWRA